MRQLAKNASDEQIENSPFGAYFMNHGRGVFPADATGVPFSANAIAVTADPIADLVEDLAAEAAALHEQTFNLYIVFCMQRVIFA